MRTALILLFFWGILTTPLLADDSPDEQLSFVDLEFGGYKFGQSPSANMVCVSGFCKSQSPGGDGDFNSPFSVYETPGAVSTQIGMTVVKPRYNFWNDQLYRVGFRVDCTPQPTEECVDDLIRSLDREYDLTPLTQSDWQQFVSGRRSMLREFVGRTGAIFRIRVSSNANEWNLPFVDIADKSIADRVGSTLSPIYRPKILQLPEKTEP